MEVLRGSAYKYDLFYSNGWTSGTHSNPIKLSLEDAIDLGSKIKNAIINGAEILENNKNTDSLETYKKLVSNLQIFHIFLRLGF